MPQNVEVKVRVSDLATVRARLPALGARHSHDEEQVDRYFLLDGARRMKLRVRRPGGAELIEYDRSEATGVRTSTYEIRPVRDQAAGLCQVPHGEPIAVVRKRRELWMLENVRIHLDTVEMLGTFLELEAVVSLRHDEAACRRQVDEILSHLGIAGASAVRASYGELVSAERG